MFYPLIQDFMSSNFKLTSKLESFISTYNSSPWRDLTSVGSLSIRRRGLCSQSIVIYPHIHYPFFVETEMQRVIEVAQEVGVSVYFDTENGMPVIVVKDYYL